MKRKLNIVLCAGVVTAVVLPGMLRVGAASPVMGTFTAQGPAGISLAQKNGPTAGAINSLVAHPTDPDVIWIGSVNGGVWKTTNATDPKPHWVPLTDHQPSLSIGSLALDPTFAEPVVLVAGIGTVSSFGRGGPLTGILRTTDGGDHWTALGGSTLSGQSITGVAPRNQDITVTTKSGIWFSRNTGATFTHLGQPGGPLRKSATDLVGDPLNLDVLYAGIVGPGGGVFRSDDGGVSWHNDSDARFGQPGGPNLVATAKKILLSVHDDGTNDAVYAGIIGADKNPTGIFRSTDRGATWTALDIPPVETEAQGRLSILADPARPQIVYLGGDQPIDGNDDGGGNGPIYRCNASFPRGLQCISISGPGTRDRSHPHEDSRRMQFDAAGHLLETDDGGIFKNDRPRSQNGAWTSVDGDLSITETHSCRWDHVRHVAICGTQDNGTVEQQTPGAATWQQILGADGGDVAMFQSSGFSISYFSEQHLDDLTRQVCLGPACFQSKPEPIVRGTNLSIHDADLSLEFFYKGPNPTPIAVHQLHPNRLVIATSFVWESDDSGKTVTALGGFSGLSTRALAYGSPSNNDVLFVGSSNGLFRHTAKFEPLGLLGAYPGAAPAGIALDPADWHSGWVVDATSVLHTPDGGDHWHNVTGDLTSDVSIGGAGAQRLYTIAFVPSALGSRIFVGASDGLYVASEAQPRLWHKVGGRLPHALVYDLDFDAQDNLLLVSTVGRGAWTLAEPGNIQLP